MWDKQIFSKNSEMFKKEQKHHKAQLIKKSRGTIMLFSFKGTKDEVVSCCMRR